jgi:peroxiredoxin
MSRDALGGRARQYLSEGDRAPEFEFNDRSGKLLRSSDLLRQGPVLLTFYRGAWCTCCRSDLRDLMRVMPEVRKTCSTVLGVFHELSPEANSRVSREYALDFPLVNDVGGRAAEAFGIRRTSAEMARIESEFGPELLALKEGEPWILPMQARFVIATDGVVAHSEVVFDYDERSSARGLMPILQGLS